MKKSKLIQIKKILINWIILEVIEWKECRNQLIELLPNELALVDKLIDAANSDETTSEIIESKVDEIILEWEDEILNYENDPEPNYKFAY